MTSLTDDYLFVVAIDIGTTYSGYAFSSRDDFKKDPMKIIANQAWNTGCQRHLSLKTPTCLLLGDNEKFVSFGYEAENKYSDIVIDRKKNEYFFFQRFKMQLYKIKKIKGEMIIEDVCGKPVTMMKVFGTSIRALINHLFDKFTERGLEIKPEEIRWVLTVPSIWSDAAKQFMRKCAILSGIKDNQLLIALEPEAASIYCQYVPTEKLKGAERGFSISEEGTQYMVVDSGGGTTDITVHEKLSNGRLKELCRASGGDCGGISVDKALYQIFVKLVGAPMLNAMKEEDPSAYLDIFREFEAVKRTVYTYKDDKVNMSIPRSILDKICQKHLNEDFEAVIQSSLYHDKLILRHDKLRIDTNLIIDMFKQASERIIELISDVLKKMKGSNLEMIVLVGGFSGCKIIQDNIKSFFPSYRVIVPEDTELAVLKGAVLFGHKPDYIAARIARYTYGVDIMVNFNPDIHEPGRCVVRNGMKMCKNIFDIYIKTGSVVELGAKITNEFITMKPFQSRVSFPVFQSTIECPHYTNVEGCTKLGSLELHIQDPSEEMRKFRVNMIFGNTELKVTAFDEKSGVECAIVLDLI